MNAWKRWCESIGELRNMEDIPTAELSSLLVTLLWRFTSKMEESMSQLNNSILPYSFDHYLKDNGQTKSIMLDREFEGSRRSTKQLGDHSPHSLLQTMWYFNMAHHAHFGWRGWQCDEHCHACLGDFHLSEDDKGTEYFEFSIKRGMKTRNGCEWQQERASNPQMYATGTKRCPVYHFKKYVGLRSVNANESESLLPCDCQ